MVCLGCWFVSPVRTYGVGLTNQPVLWGPDLWTISTGVTCSQSCPPPEHKAQAQAHTGAKTPFHSPDAIQVPKHNAGTPLPPPQRILPCDITMKPRSDASNRRPCTKGISGHSPRDGHPQSKKQAQHPPPKNNYENHHPGCPSAPHDPRPTGQARSNRPQPRGSSSSSAPSSPASS